MKTNIVLTIVSVPLKNDDVYYLNAIKSFNEPLFHDDTIFINQLKRAKLIPCITVCSSLNKNYLRISGSIKSFRLTIRKVYKIHNLRTYTSKILYLAAVYPSYIVFK